jgi:hypothetical protein
LLRRSLETENDVGGRQAATVEEASKAIRLCKLPWLCIVGLNAVTAVEKPADPAFG